MQNLNEMLTEENYVSQTHQINQTLASLIQTKHFNAQPTSWEDVQKIVRAGRASRVFSIGDQLTCQRGNDTLVWDVIGIDHDTPSDPQFTHSLTLQLHDCFPTTMQFDAPEAFYYAENGLEAGTYHFTIDSTDYQFTLESAIAAGSQLILGFTSDVPSAITVASTRGGTVSEGSIAVTVGSGGNALDTDYLNDINRVIYGSNNYKESAIRQWLNSDAAAGSVWSPQNNFDRPSSWSGNTAGFLNGMDADFLAVIGNVTKVTARNTTTDGGGSDTTTEKFFLLSRSEVYGGVEVNNVNEGEPYPYYADYSKLSVAGESNDTNRVKRFPNGNVVDYWLCRTPNVVGNAGYTRKVNLTGGVKYHKDSSQGGIAPACNII